MEVDVHIHVHIDVDVDVDVNSNVDSDVADMSSTVGGPDPPSAPPFEDDVGVLLRPPNILPMIPLPPPPAAFKKAST